MTPLACPLSELSPSLQARTLRAHTVWGLAWYLSSPPDSHRHPLDLAFLLGLSSKVRWFRTASETAGAQASNAAAKQVFILAAASWQKPLADFCAHTIHTRFKALPEATPASSILESVTSRLVILEQQELSILSATALKGELMKEPGASSIPPEIYTRLEASLAELEQALLNKDPMMPQHLRSSHALLVSYPETVNLLDDSDVARLIQAAEIHTKTEIVKATATGKGGGAGSRKKISIDDL